MKKVLAYLGKQILLFLLVNITYLILCHMSFLDITGVAFYDGMFRVVLSVCLVELLAFLLRRKIRMEWRDVMISFLISFCFLLTFFSLVLTSLDRSYSVFLLCYMNNHYGQEVATEEELDHVMNDIFVDEYGMLERRFTEQTVSGNIAFDEVEGGYYLTAGGSRMVSLFQLIGNLYGIDDRFINP